MPEYFLATIGGESHAGTGAAMAPVPAPAAPASMPDRPDFDQWGDPLPKMRLSDTGVALIPIQGAILKGASGSAKYFLSVTSYEDIGADIDAALTGARAIVLLGKSGGGTITGAPELSAKVASIARSGYPILSYTEDQLCSSVEMITAGCTARFATASAICGSIGVIWERLDTSKHLAGLGISYNVFTSGKFKSYGRPHTELTDDQKDWLQSFVDARGAEFRDHMQAHRPRLPAEAMEGQIFTGHQAAKIGLIDATVSGLPEVLALL